MMAPDQQHSAQGAVTNQSPREDMDSLLIILRELEGYSQPDRERIWACVGDFYGFPRQREATND